ncbi:MAG: saccharopine dehydrogenase C-terminal domain-containing protein [Candidatus Obscuribacterales bacterium]
MRFLVLGAGRMGYAVVYDLVHNSSATQIMICDTDEKQLERIYQQWPDKRIAMVVADVADLDESAMLMSACDVAISCVTYKHNYDLAKLAMEAGAHFVDLGGNEDVVRKEFLLDEMAREKNVAIIPDCGLAPGMVSILAADAVQEFDEVTEIRLRVGGLPAEPRPPLNYALFYSVDGLINEYTEDVTVIREGKLMRVPSLSDVETLEFPQPFGVMEAFNTSGGISTLPTTLGDKVKHLDYKAIRYPGHCQQVRLLRDLGLMDSRSVRLNNQISVPPRAVLASLLSQKLPKEETDVVLVRVSVLGMRQGEPAEIVWEAIDYMDEKTGLSAMMRTTAFPASIIAQMVADNEITSRGTLAQETAIPTKRFLEEMRKRGVEFTRKERNLAHAR